VTAPLASEIQSRRRGTTCEIDAQGELDLLVAPSLEGEINAALDGRPETLVLDLRDVTFIDSTALRALLAARRRAVSEGVRYVVLAAPGPVRRLFEVCGVADLLTDTGEPPETGRAAPTITTIWDWRRPAQALPSTKISHVRSGSWWSQLMNATTGRPVAS